MADKRDEEDDPIVEEIPFFVSNALAEQLYLMQYPIKDDFNNFEVAGVVNCCVKPHHEVVKVDFAVSTKSKNYDAFKGDMLALEADGKAEPKHGRGANATSDAKKVRPTFPNGRMDKLSYTSSKPSQNVNRYVIGVLTDKEVHCTPLKSILQMRPSLSYHDKKDARNKVETALEVEEAVEDADDEELAQVTVKFQSNERIQKLQEESYQTCMAKVAEEPWCETMWCSRTSTTAQVEKQRLYCKQTMFVGHTLGLNTKDYVKALIPPERKEISIDSIVPSKVIHASKLRTLLLVDQIRNILLDLNIISFQHLSSLLDKSLSRDKIIHSLLTVGLMIRGNWVLQSDQLYPDKSFSQYNGIPAEFMCRARDYILYQFMKKTSVSRQKMAEVTQLPTEEVTDILQGVALLNRNTNEYELKLEPDRQFEQRYSDMVHRQELMWRAKQDQFAEMEAEKPAVVPKRTRKRSVRESKAQSGTPLPAALKSQLNGQ